MEEPLAKNSLLWRALACFVELSLPSSSLHIHIFTYVCARLAPGPSEQQAFEKHYLNRASMEPQPSPDLGPSAFIFTILTTLLSFPFKVVLGVFWRRWRRQRHRRLAVSGSSSQLSRTVAFFHPFTLDGGGGERVLWCSIRALQKHQRQNRRSDDCIIVYSGDEKTAEELCHRAQVRRAVVCVCV